LDADVLIESIEDGVAVLTLNRPESLNALDPGLMRRLLEAVSRVAVDETVRCVVLTGAGRGFCAGGDVKAIGKAAEARVESVEAEAAPRATTEARARWLRRSAEAARLLHEMPKPTIAMINGACAGAGLSLAAACDFRFAAHSAKFRAAFTTSGMPGDYGGSWLWTRILGPAKARQLYFIDAKRDAQAALEFGLVDAVHPDEALHDTVLAIARQLASLPGAGLAYAKANLNAALTEPFAASLDRESLAMMLARNVLVEERRRTRA
jgi:2-(1,2-epoxy-1,2-dihydrophenyl)acetyl-CoA isomerase